MLELKKLHTNQLLLLATRAATRGDLEAYLKEIATRKRISEPSLLIPLYEKIWSLARAFAPSATEVSKPSGGVSYFPTTVIIPNDKYGHPLDSEIVFNDYTALYLCGYKVGKKEGLSEIDRRAILTSFMEKPLNPMIIEIFGNVYGAPYSMERLMKIANILASNCKLRKRRRDAANYSLAISHYEDDLAFLRRKYFDSMRPGRPREGWPNAVI